LVIALLACLASTPALAVEGPTAAGPIGGTDLRSALLPPPGLYVGTIQAAAGTFDFLDGEGRKIPALKDAHLSKQVGGPFLYYVSDVKVLGGSIGFGGIIPMGNQCGHLFIGEANRCEVGLGDPYLEVDWARFFGTLRPSRYEGAFPIPEGLSIMAGFGVVLPIGTFDHDDPLSQALSMGNNIWDFAPSFAVTYTTPPILAEGTEISAKFYWNNYLENPATHYWTGDVLDVDFAVSEHIGPLQIGVAGNYAFQINDDRQFGVPIPPDGRQGAVLQLGAVAAYDLPQHAASLKLKATTSLLAENTPTSWVVVLGWLKKF
jgi:hypothetical protein